jgi:uncharacterized pyridoxamine 5'-phosphate oxidase family protein
MAMQMGSMGRIRPVPRLSEKRVSTVLDQNRSLIVATAGHQDIWTTVLYVARQELDLYFITYEGSRTYRNLRENPRLAFTAGNPQDPAGCLHGHGIGEIVGPVNDNEEMYKLILAQVPQLESIVEEAQRTLTCVIVKLVPDEFQASLVLQGVLKRSKLVRTRDGWVLG